MRMDGQGGWMWKALRAEGGGRREEGWLEEGKGWLEEGG